MTAPTRRRLLVPTAPDGSEIGHCTGCRAWPIRASWLAPCPRCRVHVCRVCREEACACGYVAPGEAGAETATAAVDPRD